MQNTEWELWRSFLATAENGSLSGAARSLSLTQPTVGRHIDKLESSIGTSLFTRSQSGLLPTSTALNLLPYARDMSAAAQALIRMASGEAGSAAGVVRLTASHVVGAELLPPVLAEFRKIHPDIQLEVVLSDRQDDLLRHDADIAVRMTRPSQSALVARKVGDVGIGLYADADYLNRCGLPTTTEALLAHSLIGVDRATYPIAALSIGDTPVTPQIFSYRCDNDLGQLAAVRAGIGIGVCQHVIAARDPNLVAVMPDKINFQLGMWLAMHEDLRSTYRIRLLFDFLAEEMGALVGSDERESQRRE
ncbi:MAG: LysR family transcriptional regulator [Pseudomonadales bacterium]